MSGHIRCFLKTGVAWAISLAALAALPSTALAGDRYDHDDRYDRGSRYSRDDDWRGRDFAARVDVAIRSGGSWERVSPAPVPCAEERVWVEPVYRTVCDRAWVPATYRTVIDKVWVEPVVEHRTDRVWVPDRYETRDVVGYDQYGRRCTRREQVLVECGHFAYRPCDVVVTPGYFKECPRQELVCDGHWDNVERQELVSAGHWEVRPVIAAAPGPRYEDRSSARIDLRFPIRW
jgi:hypothetical protein